MTDTVDMPRTSLRNRIKAAWNVLRNRPTMFGCHVGGVIFAPDSPRLLLVGNHFDGRVGGPDAGVTVLVHRP